MHQSNEETPKEYVYHSSVNLVDIAENSNSFNNFMSKLVLHKCKDGKLVLETLEESTESLKKVQEEERQAQFNKSREQVIKEMYEAGKKLPNNKRDVHDIIGVKQEYVNERYIPSKHLGSSGLINSNFSNIVPPTLLESKGEKQIGIEELNENIKEAKKHKNILVSDEFKKAIQEEIIKEKSKEYPNQRQRENVASEFLRQYRNKLEGDAFYNIRYRTYLDKLCDNPDKWTTQEYYKKYEEYCESLDCLIRRDYFEEELGKLRKLTNEEYGNFNTKLDNIKKLDDYDEMAHELNKLRLVEKSRLSEQVKKEEPTKEEIKEKPKVEEPKNNIPYDELMPNEYHRISIALRLLDNHKPHDTDMMYNQHLKYYADIIMKNPMNLNNKQFESKYSEYFRQLSKMRSIGNYKESIEKLSNITEEEKNTFKELLKEFEISDATWDPNIETQYLKLKLQSELRCIKIN